MGPQGKAGRVPALAGGPVAGRGNSRPALIRRLSDFAHDTRGATAIEYSIIAVLISIMIIGGLTLIGPAIMDMLDQASAPF